MSLPRVIFATAASLLLGLVSAAHAQINAADQLYWHTIYTGTNSRFDSQEMNLIRTENDFRRYWTRNTGQKGDMAPKNIDWVKENVLTLNLGTRRSSGYSVTVERVVKNGIYATVHAAELVPADGQFVIKSPSSPFVIIAIQKNSYQYRLSATTRENRGDVEIYSRDGVTISGQQNANYYVDPKYACNWNSLKSGTDSNILDAGMVVLNNQADLARYWERATGRGRDSVPQSVNWTEVRLVAIHLGQRKNDGFSVSVGAVEKRGMGAIIHATEFTPHPGQVVNFINTHPFIIIQVERSVSSFKLDLQSRQTSSDITVNGG